MCNMHDTNVCPWNICIELHEPSESPVPQLHGSKRKLLMGEWMHIFMQQWFISGIAEQLLKVHPDNPVCSWIL